MRLGLHTGPFELVSPCKLVSAAAGTLQVTSFAQADDQASSSIRKDVTNTIKALGRAKKPKEAVAQLRVLAEAKLQPDRQAATALVDACARNGAMVMAQKAFDELFGTHSGCPEACLVPFGRP